MTGPDRVVLGGLGVLVCGMPLLQGGEGAAAVLVGVPLALALAGVTMWQRRRRGATVAHGLAPLAAFAALGLAATVPLPPAVLHVLAPTSTRLYAANLPAWPASDTWRPIAIDPWRTWLEMTRVGVAFVVFAVLVAFPWRPDGSRRGGVVVTQRFGFVLLGGAALLAGITFVAQAAGEHSSTLAALGIRRGAGPFADGDALAAWLGGVLPVAAAFVAVSAGRAVRRVLPGGLAAALHRGRLPIAALVRGQRRLYVPVVAASGLAALVVAHGAAGSSVGAVALAAGTAVLLVAASSTRAARVGAGACIGLAAVAVVAWGVRDGHPGGDPAALASRVGVAWQSVRAVREAAALGTGFGSWPAVYRPLQAPPVQAVAWTHAYDEWVELLIETGVVGLGLVLLFAFSVVRAGRRDAAPDGASRIVRAGLAGGIAVLLVHACLGAALRTPADLVLLMALLGLFVQTGRAPSPGSARALGVLTIVLAAAALPLAADALRVVAGRAPHAPAARLRLAAASASGPRAAALALVRGAVDRAPAEPAAHAALAAWSDDTDGDEALARAVRLAPWDAELRDRLALRLAKRDVRAAAEQLEESVARTPALAAHPLLARAAAPGDVDSGLVAVSVAKLTPDLGVAVVRGFGRALAEAQTPAARSVTLRDLVMVHEARGDWAAAAAALRAEAAQRTDVAVDLGRAARDLLRAGRPADAETTLLDAVRRTPDEGTLYRSLAVDVYAARGQFDLAEQTLERGERNARDMDPVYDGVAELLTRREASWHAAADR